MGCDIYVIAEVRTDGVWKAITEPIFEGDRHDIKAGHPLVTEPFGWRNYTMFTFFAGVRDRGDAMPLSPPRGLPADATNDAFEMFDDPWANYHSKSWLSVADLDVDHSQYVPEGLSDQYFSHLNTLKSLGSPADVRIVFAFDN